MTPNQLKQWRMNLPRGDTGKPLSRAAAARLLNNTPANSYCDWEAGRRPIPRMLPLACFAVAKGWSVPTAWRDDPAYVYGRNY